MSMGGLLGATGRGTRQTCAGSSKTHRSAWYADLWRRWRA